MVKGRKRCYKKVCGEEDGLVVEYWVLLPINKHQMLGKLGVQLSKPKLCWILATLSSSLRFCDCDCHLV